MRTVTPIGAPYLGELVEMRGGSDRRKRTLGVCRWYSGASVGSSRGFLAAFVIALLLAITLTQQFSASASVEGQSEVAYVVSRTDSRLLAYDPEQQSVVRDIAVDPEPIDIAVSEDGSRAYILHIGRPGDNYDAQISVLDATELSMPKIETIDLPDDLIDTADRSRIVLTPDEKRIYVTVYDSIKILHIDLATSEYSETGVVTFPSGMAFLPGGDRAYVAGADGNGSLVLDTDPESPTFNQQIGSFTEDGGELGRFSASVVISPDGATAYFGNGDEPQVSIVDTATDTVIDDITIGRLELQKYFGDIAHALQPADGAGDGITPSGPPVEFLALSRDGEHLYLPHPQQAPNLSIVETGSISLLQPLDLEGRQREVELSIDGNLAVSLANRDPVGLSYLDADRDSPTFNQLEFYAELNLSDASGLAVAPLSLEESPSEDPEEDPVDPGEDGDSGDDVNAGVKGGTSSSTSTLFTPGSALSNACKAPGPGVSVSHWKRTALGQRARLKLLPGATLSPGNSGTVVLQRRGTKGRRASSYRSVRFSVDGRETKVVSRVPYRARLPENLGRGYHRITAVVTTEAGKSISFTRSININECVTDAFSVSMSSKVRGASTDVLLRLSRQAGPISDARFELGRLLVFKPVRGKRVGTFKITGKSGKTTRKALIYPRRGRTLYDGSKGRVTLRKIRTRLDLSGLTKDAKIIELKLNRRYLKNLRSGCGSSNTFTVEVTYFSGNSQSFKRGLKHCKK